MKRTSLILLFLSLSVVLFTQQADSLLQAGRETIKNKIEHLYEASEAGIDLSELTDVLEYFLQNPVNINSAEKRQLKQLNLLNDIQIKNIIDYRNKYGDFYSIYELRAIEGMSRNSLEKIIPFVVVKKADEPFSMKRHLTKGRHELLFRYQRKLVSQSGYFIPPDSLQLEGSNSFYLGDPNRYYLRYKYKSYGKLSLGLTAEKDPGEICIRPNPAISDSLRKSLRSFYGMDFYSGHLSLKDLGIIKTLIIGDYHVQCGQGLTLWSGLSFGGGSNPSSFKRYSGILKPNTSANENLFMRGIAGRLKWKGIDVSLFYSRNKVDANMQVSANGDTSVSSMPESGYHRTFNELEDKRSLVSQYFGTHLNLPAERFRLGLTAYRSVFTLSIEPKDDVSRIFQFSGKENFNVGINFDILLRKTNIFGEFAYSINGGFAFLGGFTLNTNNGSIFSIQFREYRKEYQNLLAAAGGNREGNSNERGIKLAMEIPLGKKVTLRLYSEHFVYPWLTTRSNNVSRGQIKEFLINFRPGSHSSIRFRYIFRKNSNKSSDNLSWIDEMGYANKHNFSFKLRQMMSPVFSIQCQLEHSFVKEFTPDIQSKGSLIFFDMFYHPEAVPLKISFRYALFNTDDYACRLYAYEHDVLYASSMPAYYGKGFRTYFLVSYSPAKWIQCWLRFSMTNYTDRNVISSGLEEINGNKLPEIKFQTRIKL